MLNINTIEQKDFQAGELQHLPDNQIPDNGVLRLLNLIPGDNSEPLALRHGFQPWSFNATYSGDVINVSRYIAHAVLNTDPDSPFLTNGYLVAFHDGTLNIGITAVLPYDSADIPSTWYTRNATATSNVLTNASHGLLNGMKVRTASFGLSDGYYYVIDKDTNTFKLSTSYGGSASTLSNGSGTYGEEIINDELVWSTYGGVEPNSSEEPPPPAENPLPAVSYMYTEIPNKSIFPTTPTQTIIDDYWSDTSGLIDGFDSENNLSYWRDGTGTYDWGGQVAIGDFTDFYWGGDGYWMPGDRWSSSIGVWTTADETLANTLRIHYPVYFEYNTPAAAPTATWKVPEAKEPYFVITGLDLGIANRELTFEFEYDLTSAEKYGLCAYVFLKQNGTPDTAWGTAINSTKPVVMTEQTLLSDPADRYTQGWHTDNVDGNVLLTYTAPYPKVDIKVVFLPYDTYDGVGDTIGGTFRSLAVG